MSKPLPTPPAGDAEKVDAATKRMAERFGVLFTKRAAEYTANGAELRSALVSVIATTAYQLIACGKDNGMPRAMIARNLDWIFEGASIPQDKRDVAWEKASQNFAEGIASEDYIRVSAEMSQELAELLRGFSIAYEECGMDRSNAAAAMLVTAITQVLKCMKANDCSLSAVTRIVDKVYGS